LLHYLYQVVATSLELAYLATMTDGASRFAGAEKLAYAHVDNDIAKAIGKAISTR
jgi:hypothetical protein